MFRKLVLLVALAHWLLLPLPSFAGGPPLLCVPIDGVTAENAGVLTALIETKLKDRIWSHSGEGAEITRQGEQHYLTFRMQKDVALDDIEAALDGSGFTITRGRLRLFGHVILQVDAAKTPSKELVAALDSMNHVAINEVDENDDVVLITLEMPYPTVNGQLTIKTDAWGEKFTRQYSENRASDSEPPATRQTLPGYNAIREVLAEHNASLKGVRWSMSHACRALGCVSVPKEDVVATTAAGLITTKKN